MHELEKNALIQVVIDYLRNALEHIIKIKDCDQSSALTNIIHGALVFSETIYDASKKNTHE